MRRGTTPTLTISITDATTKELINPRNFESLYVTLQQGDTQITDTCDFTA